MNTKAPPNALYALVMGAGAGSRFGGGKLLAPWRGGTVLEAALAAAFAAPVEAVLLTAGADAAVEGAARAWADKAGVAGRLRILAVPDWRKGMAASLRAGVAALPSDAGGVYVFLGDMPRVPVAVLPALADALAAGAPAAVPTFDGRRGHPALIGAGLFGEVAKLSGDKGARGLLDALGASLAEVPAPDDGVLFDVDTPADLD